MSKQAIVKLYEHSAKVNQIVQQLQQQNTKLHLQHLAGSSLSFVISSTFKQLEKPYLLIFNDKEEAAYYLNDLEQLLGEQNVLFYPGSYRRPYQIEETDNVNILLRSEVLNRINSRKKPAIIVTYPDALFEKVVTKSELERNTLKLRVGEQISLDFVNEMLFEYHFNRVDFVTEPGEFAVRGGIVDVFSFSNEEPYRIEFFGDEVESIRTFDIETQLSIEKEKKISILPNVENKKLQEKRESFLKYISDKTVIFIKNKELLFGKLDKLFEKATTAFAELNQGIKLSEPRELFSNGDFIKTQLDEFTLVNIGHHNNGRNHISKRYHNLRSINNSTCLSKTLIENTKKGIDNYLFCANQKQADRFHGIFDDVEQDVKYHTIVFPLYQGFIDLDNKIACYTDHEIFERYHKFRLKSGFAKKQAITLKELTTLDIGDYVTHIDHGIGKFGGLQKIDVEGKQQEAIKLIYGDRDVLYISIHSLHKITKFNGKDGKPPKIYKLGSGAWKKLKQKTKARVKEIAYDLIQLYAKRKMQKGFVCNPDSYMQLELESSFMYEDTPDQLTATQDIKTDMESEQPMDQVGLWRCRFRKNRSCYSGCI